MNAKFEQITGILFSAIKIPIAFFDTDGMLLFEFYYKSFSIPPSIRKDIVLPLILKNRFSGILPEVHMGSFLESYISMAVKQENKFCGTLILGPFMRKRMSEDDVSRLLARRDTGMETKSELLAFYNRLRLLTRDETIDVAMHLHYYYYKTLLEPDDVAMRDASREPRLTNMRQPRAAQLESEIFASMGNGSDPVAQCKEYIMSKPYSQVTLKNLSELVDLNPSYLSRMFKTVTGISVTEYSQIEKVEEAKILIEEDVLSLSEIGDTLGFYDYNHFAKIFKSITGTTPNQYRRFNARRSVRGF